MSLMIFSTSAQLGTLATASHAFVVGLKTKAAGQSYMIRGEYNKQVMSETLLNNGLDISSKESF